MNKPLHHALVSFLLNKADDKDVVALYNEHATPDAYVYNSIEDIADEFATDDPTKTQIARMVFFGDVESWHARFFTLDGYGNIYSFGWLTDRRCPIDFKRLAVQIIETQQYDAVGFNADPYLSDDE